MKFVPSILLGILGTVTLWSSQYTMAAGSTGCSASPCLSPSQSQADALFARIEQAYPQYFPAGAATAGTTLNGATAWFRSYAGTAQTGLATYQSGLWYALGSQWQRYASLDDANRQFCAGACWSGSTALAYPVIDTGQSASYNTLNEIPAPLAGQSFYGQDTQYAGAQPSYQTSADGKTVADLVTGLIWMRAPNSTLVAPSASDKKTLSQAQAWVSTVNTMAYGGYNPPASE